MGARLLRPPQSGSHAARRSQARVRLRDEGARREPSHRLLLRIEREQSGTAARSHGSEVRGTQALLARAGDRFEVPVGWFVIGLVRADGELVEVQTCGW